MVEERKNYRSIEIVDGEGRRFDAVSLTNKSQEQAKSIPVGGESPGAGMFLIEQMLDEEGLHQARRRQGRRCHISPCWFANDSKRLPALLRRSGVAVKYQ